MIMRTRRILKNLRCTGNLRILQNIIISYHRTYATLDDQKQGSQTSPSAERLHIGQHRKKDMSIVRLEPLRRLAVDHLDALFSSDQSSPLKSTVIARIVRAIYNAPQSESGSATHQDQISKLLELIQGTQGLASKEIYYLLLEEVKTQKFSGNSDGVEAEEIWASMIAAGIEPDANCYTALIGATCIDFNEMINSLLAMGSAKRNEYLTVAEVKARSALGLYHDMISKNIRPNATTIEMLMLAYGRCANIRAVLAIVSQTWGITIQESTFLASVKDRTSYDDLPVEDIYLRLKGFSDAGDSAKITRDSDLFPTQNTLRTLVTACGACQQNGLGILVMRALAREYKLNITAQVWGEVMKWAYKESCNHKRKNDSHLVDDLFHIAQDQYQVVPTTDMYYFATKNKLFHSKFYNPTAFKLLDDMLLAVERCSQNIGFRELRDRIEEVRESAQILLDSVEKSMSTKLRQHRNEIVKATKFGHTEKSEKSDELLQGRSQKFNEVRSLWTERIRQFEARTEKLLRSRD